ncbi:TcmI family type II polyketide cyclase [Streptomyces sp. WAC06614]|uniref:TcmI family type II polyketide cyclase n=1 Tax=Streptomyces sp. WAC06614 TaxID=2487416 RepID=UPI000F7736CC|nr:TcmI family type II polyketide cyclase [Streptomyces sp. WAC06614]RSS76643.1 TcmI family type II polyketide cyclase [Streptomyces sp. WAC06614]
MHRTLIVARMAPGSAPDIAELFAASDQGELPEVIGVTGRSLFQFGELYFHLIESDRPTEAQIAKAASHPEFKRLSQDLQAYVSAHDPATWRSPKDAMAQEFYRWERPALR